MKSPRLYTYTSPRSISLSFLFGKPDPQPTTASISVRTDGYNIGEDSLHFFGRRRVFWPSCAVCRANQTSERICQLHRVKVSGWPTHQVDQNCKSVESIHRALALANLLTLWMARDAVIYFPNCHIGSIGDLSMVLSLIYIKSSLICWTHTWSGWQRQ